MFTWVLVASSFIHGSYLYQTFSFPQFSPSLINFMVFVDVKHHIYLFRGALTASVNSCAEIRVFAA